MHAHDHLTFQDSPARAWDWINAFVAKLSVTQTAAIGAGGAGTQYLTASVATDHVGPWLHIASMGVGVTVGIASLGLVLLKVVQQQREMRAWAKKNPDA